MMVQQCFIRHLAVQTPLQPDNSAQHTHPAGELRGKNCFSFAELSPELVGEHLSVGHAKPLASITRPIMALDASPALDSSGAQSHTSVLSTS